MKRKIIFIWSIYFAFVFLLFSSVTMGQTKLSYLPNKKLVRDIILENDVVKYKITIDKSVKLASVVDKKMGIDFLENNSDLMFFSHRVPRFIDDSGFHLFTLEDKKSTDEVSVSIVQQSSYVENPFIITQTFTLAEGYELHWNVELINTATGGRAYRNPQTKTSNITFPVM